MSSMSNVVVVFDADVLKKLGEKAFEVVSKLKGKGYIVGIVGDFKQLPTRLLNMLDFYPMSKRGGVAPIQDAFEIIRLEFSDHLIFYIYTRKEDIKICEKFDLICKYYKTVDYDNF